MEWWRSHWRDGEEDMCIGAAMHVTIDVDDVACASKSTSQTLMCSLSTQLRRNEDVPTTNRATAGIGLGRHQRDALIEIEQWQLKWSCRAQKLDIEIVPMGDEAASRTRHGETVRQRGKWRHAYRQDCRRGYWLLKECQKVFDRPCAARRPTSVSGLQREATPLTPTNTFRSLN
jgi:hypothetical protein